MKRVGLFPFLTLATWALFSLRSEAIEGVSLPPEALPEYACALYADTFHTHTKAPGKEEKTVTEKNRFFCSATATQLGDLKQPIVVTAGHCDPAQIAQMEKTDDYGVRTRYGLEGGITLKCGKHVRVLQTGDFLTNPMFRVKARMKHSNADRFFDLSVLRLSSPLGSLKTARFASSFDEVLKIAQRGILKQNCRSFGYGRDNDGQFGNLNGALTPITALSPRNAQSDLVPDREGNRVEGGTTGPGDSGGPLVCSDAQGEDVIVGVVSRGMETFATSSERISEISIYSLLSFQNPWIELSKDPSNARSEAGVRGYMLGMIGEMRKETTGLVKRYRKAFTRDFYKETQRQLKALEQELDPKSAGERDEGLLIEAYDRLVYIGRRAIQAGEKRL